MMFWVDRSDEEIGGEADHEEGDHEVEDGVIGVGRVDAGVFLGFGDAIDELGAEDGGDAPSGDEAPVDGADALSTEEVAKVSGDGGKAAAVGGEDET